MFPWQHSILEQYRSQAIAKETELLARRKQRLEELRSYVQHRMVSKSSDGRQAPRIQVSKKYE